MTPQAWWLTQAAVRDSSIVEFRLKKMWSISVAFGSDPLKALEQGAIGA
ncbi:MAG: hypothetical protein ACR5K7_06125 [Symbiopectobacterium sp.]